MGWNVAKQLEGQEIPAGLLIIRPLPGPMIDTCRLRLDGVPPSKSTETVRAPVTVNVQLRPDVLPHPLQPPKSEKTVGVAISVTIVPRAKVPLHGLPEEAAQLIPGGLLVIAPLPVPVLRMVIKSSTGGPFANVAVAIRSVLPKLMVQTLPDTLLQPFQPPKFEPGAAVAVNVACEPLGKTAVH